MEEDERAEREAAHDPRPRFRGKKAWMARIGVLVFLGVLASMHVAQCRIHRQRERTARRFAREHGWVEQGSAWGRWGRELSLQAMEACVDLEEEDRRALRRAGFERVHCMGEGAYRQEL